MKRSIPCIIMLGFTLISCSKNTPDVRTVGAPTTMPAAQSSASSTCLASHMTAKISEPSGSAGSQYYTVTLHNTGQACSLAGYPGVSLVDIKDNQIGAPAKRSGQNISTITVPANGSASFSLEISNALLYGDCTPAQSAGLKIYPPENTEWITIPLSTQTCTQEDIHTMTISPVS